MAKKEKEKNNINMRIKAMSFDELTLENPKKLVHDGQFKSGQFDIDLNFAIGFQTLVFVKLDLFQVSVVADIHTKNQKNKDFKLGTFQFTVDFEIKDVLQFNIATRKNSKHQILLPPELELNLISIAFCSARGALFTKTLGMFTGAITLPILDPKEMRKKIQEKYDSKTPTLTAK